MQWVEDTDVLEMIVDKFGSSVSSIQYIAYFSYNMGYWASLMGYGCPPYFIFILSSHAMLFTNTLDFFFYIL